MVLQTSLRKGWQGRNQTNNFILTPVITNESGASDRLHKGKFVCQIIPDGRKLQFISNLSEITAVKKN